MRMGLRPRLLVGDLDSLGPDLQAWLNGTGTPVLAYPAEKDYIDAHLAIDKAIGLQPQEILLLGCIGTRLDHTLANVGLLLRCHRAGIPCRLLDENNEVILVSDETVRLSGKPGDIISLLPLSEQVTGITTRGLKYPLDEGTLSQGESRGVSNEFLGPVVSVRVGTGYLLVIRSKSS